MSALWGFVVLGDFLVSNANESGVILDTLCLRTFMHKTNKYCATVQMTRRRRYRRNRKCKVLESQDGNPEEDDHVRSGSELLSITIEEGQGVFLRYSSWQVV